MSIRKYKADHLCPAALETAHSRVQRVNDCIRQSAR